MRSFVFNASRLKKIQKITAAVCAVCFLALGILTTAFYPICKRIYPLEYGSVVFAASAEYGVEASVIFSVIKIESGFDSNAVSKKGAKGLMQLTDGTAAYVAKMLRVQEYDVSDPAVNIKFGTFYLGYLINRFHSVRTAICAYNAGEGNVFSWLKNPSYSSDGVELSRVPFAETAEYLSKYEKTLKIYRKIYGNILDKKENFK